MNAKPKAFLTKIKQQFTTRTLFASTSAITCMLILLLVIMLVGFWSIENNRLNDVYDKQVDARHQSIAKLVAVLEPHFAELPHRQQFFDSIAALTDATDIYVYSTDNPKTNYAWQRNASTFPKYLQPQSHLLNHAPNPYVVIDKDRQMIEGVVPFVANNQAENLQLYIRYPYRLFESEFLLQSDGVLKSKVALQYLALLLLVLLPLGVIFRYKKIEIAKRFERLQSHLDTMIKRMSNTQRMSKVGSWDYDVHAGTLVWSQEVFDIFGLEYDPNDTGIAKFYDAIHPDDAQMLQEVFEQSLQSESGEYDVEHRIIDYKTGFVRYLHERCVHLTHDDGSYSHSIGMVQDITEQHLAKQALVEQQHELNLILDVMADGIITIDEKGAILSFNANAEKLFGYQADEVVGKNIKCLMPPKYADHHDNYLFNYLSTGEQKIINIGREVEGLRRDGKTFMLHLTVDELPQKPNQLRRFIGSCMDLTEIKQKEEMLWRSQKLDALGKISGGIAHDFNNMLGVILGYAQLLAKQLSTNEKLSRYAEQIVYASERGATLTGKLLAFSRRRPTVQNNVNVNQLILAQTEVITTALTANVSLQLDLEPNVWITKLEEAAFDDVLLNMAINAMHAIKGHGQLIIATTNVSLNKVQGAEIELPAGDYVCLTVTDDGCGMDEQVKAQLFDPFFTTKGKEGTGFGLSQVYGFVRSAGGVIDVKSTLGEGSRFSLYFPRQLIRVGEAVVDDNSDQWFIHGDETILVVDDEPSLCLLAQSIVEKYGYDVHTANSAQQALTILAEQQVDLVISDIIMPKMNGYQLITQVKAQYPDIRCLLVSGYIGQQEQEDERQCADVTLITKPYTPHVLMRNVRVELNLGAFAKMPVQALIPWPENSAVTEQFDGILNRLLSLIALIKSAKRPDEKALKAQFVALGRFIIKYFQFEEAQMSTWDYPYLNEHIKAHRRFISQFDIQVEDMTVEQLAEVLEQFLTVWIVEHVMLMDKVVVPFISND